MDYAIRKTARAIILTPQQDVLLMRLAFPWRDEDTWILPGGGIKDGEDARSAVAREVFEETGASDIEILGEAWRQELIIEARNTRLVQRFFLVQAERFEARPIDLSEAEMEWVREYRWWDQASLSAADIVVEPKRLAEGLRTLITRGLPPAAIDIDAMT